MFMRSIRYLLPIAALVAPAAWVATNAAGQQLIAQAAQQGPALVEGEVRRIDKDAGKITLKHGPIPNLDMPGMTMVFRVKDPAMLDGVKAGDKVRFSAEQSGGALTVTKIAPAR